MDITTNSYGKKLLELCRSTPLRILNGRILGNLLGEFTCYTAQGKSAVDYLLASPSFIPEIKSMFILDLVPTLSDHTPIKFCIKINTCMIDECVITKLNPLPDKIIWNKDKSNYLSFTSSLMNINRFLLT